MQPGNPPAPIFRVVLVCTVWYSAVRSSAVWSFSYAFAVNFRVFGGYFCYFLGSSCGNEEPSFAIEECPFPTEESSPFRDGSDSEGLFVVTGRALGVYWPPALPGSTRMSAAHVRAQHPATCTYTPVVLSTLNRLCT